MMKGWWREYVTKRLTRSSEWSEVRKQHLSKNSSCIACGKTKSLQVHHIIPFAVDPSKELERDNLTTLCADCHFDWGHLKYWRAYNPDILLDAKLYKIRISMRRVI